MGGSDKPEPALSNFGGPEPIGPIEVYAYVLVILNEFKLHLALFVITYLIGRSAGRFSHYSSDGKVRIVVYFTAAEIAEKIAEICKLKYAAEGV